MLLLIISARCCRIYSDGMGHQYIFMILWRSLRVYLKQIWMNNKPVKEGYKFWSIGFAVTVFSANYLRLKELEIQIDRVRRSFRVQSLYFNHSPILIQIIMWWGWINVYLPLDVDWSEVTWRCVCWNCNGKKRLATKVDQGHFWQSIQHSSLDQRWKKLSDP